MMHSKGVWFMVISVIAFSLMHLCVKFLPGIPVLQIIMARSLFSFSVCMIELKKLRLSPWGNNKKLLLLRGVMGVLGLTFFFYTIQNIPLATAITISNLMPLFTLLLATVFINEKVVPVQWVLFLLSFVGVVLIKGFDARISNLELLIAVLGAFFAGSAHFLVRKLRDSEHSLVIIFYFPLVTIPVISPFVYLNWVTPNLSQWILLLLVAVFTHIGQVFLTRAYQKEEVSKVSNIYFLGIVLALLYGYFIFNETFNFQTLSGMFIIIAGIVLNVLVKNGTKKEVVINK